MTLWLVFPLMTVAAIFAVLWPLSRRGPAVAGTNEVAVYRDQLDEIDRDRGSGLIGAAEAESARVEVSRRLIAAAEAAATKTSPMGSSLWRRRITALVALLLLPIGAGALYLTLGEPQLPGEPWRARMAAVHEHGVFGAMVAEVEASLARNPNDVRGYAALAPIYLRLGRFDDAAKAWRKVIALAGETAQRQTDLGIALTAAAKGMVTADAKTAFMRALALDPKQLKARFFVGLAAKQSGDTARAAAIWRDMLAQVPPGGNRAANLREMLASLGEQMAPAAQPRKTALASAGQMSEQERGTVIRGMVARLAARLKRNGNDAEGWQRLLRAYMVLGDRAKAVEAAANARKALAGEPGGLRRVEDMIKTLGLEG